MNSCEEIRESLGAWLDGELSRADSEAVRLHLGGCNACGEQRLKLEKLNAAMKAILVPAVDLSFDPFWRGVRTRIEEKRTWTAEWPERLRSWFAVPSLGWAVPAVIVLVLAAISYDKLFPEWHGGAPRNNFAAVESIDGYGRNVALLREDESKTAVIWLYQNQEGDDESAGESAPKSPTF
jgi:anti-sigma factor RsiW